ncbi:MAG: hypothetical protein ABJB76_10995 [Candidatus Nitrosocosmicus sp.]
MIHSSGVSLKGERNILHNLIEDNKLIEDYRAKIILLKDDGYAVPEIRRITNHHDNTTLENGFIILMKNVWIEQYPKYTNTNQSKLRTLLKKKV